MRPGWRWRTTSTSTARRVGSSWRSPTGLRSSSARSLPNRRVLLGASECGALVGAGPRGAHHRPSELIAAGEKERDGENVLHARTTRSTGYEVVDSWPMPAGDV